MNKRTPLSLLVFAFAMNAGAIELTDSEQASFEIGGVIEPECKVTSDVLNGADSLNLSTNQTQSVANVSIWCNTGQSTATTTYSSTNNGNLISGNNDAISYSLEIDGQTYNLATPQDVSQAAGLGTQGSDIGTTVAIRPDVNGFEFAGTYSDTITVTVSPN